MNRTHRNSYIVWGLALVAFLVLELLGLEHKKDKVPWFTLSETDWAVERILPKPVRYIVQLLLVGFFASLGAHLAFGTPLLP